MHYLSARTTALCILLSSLAMQTSGYFVIDEPAAQRQWVNDVPNLVSWSKGVLDNINGFDVEMARMSTNGLVLVARNVPAKPNRINFMLKDVPPGDDYFLIFLNSTHGVMHATSHRFSIIAANTSPTSSPPSPDAGVPTVTVSGSPNPTLQFATTFPAVANSAPRNSVGFGIPQILVVSTTMISILFGAVCIVGW